MTGHQEVDEEVSECSERKRKYYAEGKQAEKYYFHSKTISKDLEKEPMKLFERCLSEKHEKDCFFLKKASFELTLNRSEETE